MAMPVDARLVAHLGGGARHPLVAAEHAGLHLQLGEVGLQQLVIDGAAGGQLDEAGERRPLRGRASRCAYRAIIRSGLE